MRRGGARLRSLRASRRSEVQTPLESNRTAPSPSNDLTGKGTKEAPMIEASRWFRLGLASALVLGSVVSAQSADDAAVASTDDAAVASTNDVEVSNFPEEQKVRVTNLDELGGKAFLVSVAVHTDKPEKTVGVLNVPGDQVLVLTDIQFGAVQDTGYRLEDGSAPQLFFRIAPGQALHYQTGVVFGPGESLKVKRSDGEPLHPFEATFMGRLIPLS